MFRIREQVSASMQTDGGEPVYILSMHILRETNAIALVTSLRTIKLYSIPDIRFRGEFRGGGQGRIYQVIASGHAHADCISCNESGEIQSWKRGTWDPIAVFDSSIGATYCIATNQNGSLIACGGSSTISILDSLSGDCLCMYSETHSADVTQLLFHPFHEDMLFSGGVDNLICWFNAKEQSDDDALQGIINVEDSIERIGFSGGHAEFMYVITGAQRFSVWDLNTEDPVYRNDDPRNYLEENSGILSNYLIDCFEMDSELYLATGDHEGNLFLNKVSSDGLTFFQSLDGGHCADVRSVLFDASSQCLLSGGEDSRLIIWTCSNDEGLGKLPEAFPFQERRVRPLGSSHHPSTPYQRPVESSSIENMASSSSHFVESRSSGQKKNRHRRKKDRNADGS